MGNVLNNKDEIFRKISPLLYILMWSGVLVSLLCINMCDSVVPQDMYLFRALVILLLIVIFLRKVNIYKLSIIVGVISAISIMIMYLFRHKDDWGITYRNLLIGKYLVFILFGVIVLDIIYTQGYLRLKEVFIPMCIVSLASILIVALFEFEEIYVILMTFVALIVSEISAEEWKKQMKYMAIGGYLSFVFLIIKSFIQSPNNYNEGIRYVGIFRFPIAAGFVASMGFICATYILLLEIRREEKKKGNIAFAGILTFIAIVMEVFFSNRASIVGLMLLFVLAIIFILGKQDRKSIRVKGIILVSCILVGSVIILIIMKSVSKMDLDLIYQKYSGNPFFMPVVYFADMSHYAFNAGAEYSLFEEGTILNALDNFSSSRLTLWIQGIKTASWLPADDFGVYYPSGAYMPHVHNQYICLIRKYGYIGGIPLIAFHIYILVLSIKACRKDFVKNYMLFCWMAYGTGVLLFEYKTWRMLPYCMIFILLYPLFRKTEKETKIEQ